MKHTTSAGGIFIKKENGRTYLLLLKYTGIISGLGFLKGHIKPGETIRQAAIREVKEEAGLNYIKIIKKIGEFTREGTDSDNIPELKTIHIYLMSAENYNHNKSDEEYGWFEFDDAVSKMAFPIEAKFLKNHRDMLK